VEQVQPVILTRGVKAVITVTGAGFEPEVFVDFDDPDGAAVCLPLRVELRAPDVRPLPAPVPLRDAVLISGSELRARLDGDAGKAFWDVVVIDTAGREATLRGALDVSNCGGSNAPCDDGEPCTYDPTFGTAADGIDMCNGNSFCAGTTFVADGTPCSFACPAAGPVPGSCQVGRCTPAPGLCDPPPACSP
jgi:hypothetical protein